MCTWQVTNSARSSSETTGQGSPTHRSPHARRQRRERRPSFAGRVAVLRIRRGLPPRRGKLHTAEESFHARTIWFSENSEPVAQVFAYHWPDAPNLGDITTIDWRDLPPVDALCGGFPCQDVSTVGKRVGLPPGTRSGLWAHMATAIGVLQPQFVVIENVRGLLS